MTFKRYTIEEALYICECFAFYDNDAITVLADYVGMESEWRFCFEEDIEDLYEEITKKARIKYDTEEA